MKKNKCDKGTPYIHYSNCHEDARLLCSYVPENAVSILSVASALDNSLALLTEDNRKVLSVDNNPTQVFLSCLKKTAIANLSYEEYLIFIGVKEGNVSELYNQISMKLDSKTKTYFDAHPDLLFEKKLIHCGRFESYFQIFKNKIFPLTTSKKRIQEFMKQETIEEQITFYQKYINTLRFKLLFKIFFSKRVMKKKGRDQAFFKYNTGSQAKALKARFELGLKHHLNKDNPYLNYVVLNEFKALPPYLEKEAYQRIQKNIDNLEIREGTILEILKEHHTFDFMNLSDIFEYMSEEETKEHEHWIVQSLSSYGRVCFWNMMNERKLRTLSRINSIDDLILDRAFYYKDFLVYEKE